MKRTHITITNPEFYDVLREDSEQGETDWTINRHAKRGDMVLLYVTSPICAIVATAVMATDAERDEEPSSEWFGHYLADMHSLRMLKEPLGLSFLRAAFPSWGYWKQPRNSVQVPEQFVSQLERLLG